MYAHKIIATLTMLPYARTAAAHGTATPAVAIAVFIREMRVNLLPAAVAFAGNYTKLADNFYLAKRKRRVLSDPSLFLCRLPHKILISKIERYDKTDRSLHRTYLQCI